MQPRRRYDLYRSNQRYGLENPRGRWIFRKRKIADYLHTKRVTNGDIRRIEQRNTQPLMAGAPRISTRRRQVWHRRFCISRRIESLLHQPAGLEHHPVFGRHLDSLQRPGILGRSGLASNCRTYLPRADRVTVVFRVVGSAITASGLLGPDVNARFDMVWHPPMTLKRIPLHVPTFHYSLS